jgi:hypothetical protein
MLLGGIYPLPPEIAVAGEEKAVATGNHDPQGSGHAVVLLKARSA